MLLKPSRIPSTSTPCRSARIVAALITLLMPGAGPPPTRMASFSFVTCASPWDRGVRDLRTLSRRLRAAAHNLGSKAGRRATDSFDGSAALDRCAARARSALRRARRHQRRLDHPQLPADLRAHATV